MCKKKNHLIKREQSKFAYYAERENGRMEFNHLIKREQSKLTHYAEHTNSLMKYNHL